MPIALTRSVDKPASSELPRGHVHADLFSVVFDLLIVWDAVSVAMAGVLSAFVYSLGASRAEFALVDDHLFRISLIGAVLSPVVLRERWSHLAFSTIASSKLVARLLTRVCLLALLVLAVVLVTKSFDRLPPVWAGEWFIFTIAGVAGGRFLLLGLMRGFAAKGWVADRVAVLGWGPAADWLEAALAQARPYGVSTVSPAPVGAANRLERALADLLDRGRRGQVDRVVLALPEGEGHRLQSVVHRLKALEIEVSSLYPGFAQLPGKVRSTQIAGVPLYLVTRRPQYRWGVLAKAIEDRVLGLLIVVALSPLLAAVALAVRLDSRGPVIFRQRRHGLNGTEFDVFKFRTMKWQGAWGAGGDVQTSRRDSRITRIGAILRRTSLDELPQLINVLNGTMSLVGPRPHPVSMRTEQRLGDEIIAEYAHRHRVKPGITGWAQINGLRGATDTADKLRRRVEHDIYYVENWSLPFDILILVSTLFFVIFKRSNAF